MLRRMLPAPPVRERPPGPDDRVLRLRIPWVRADAAWAGGCATRSDGEPTALKRSRRGLIGRPEVPHKTPRTASILIRDSFYLWSGWDSNPRPPGLQSVPIG